MKQRIISVNCCDPDIIFRINKTASIQTLRMQSRFNHFFRDLPLPQAFCIPDCKKIFPFTFSIVLPFILLSSSCITMVEKYANLLFPIVENDALSYQSS